ncbi:hypothetical protein GCM10009601_10340 [Streptomyces thermospinosisporus]|uniref:Peptidase C14 caspase domain-containing protein n=1 Tax=Streptomyces thermospinosisporus TaxID=161482 RepID=A0ABP4J9Z0_9ACTN
MRLPDPQRSYAVLIGTGTYRSGLRNLPAVRNNLRDLQAVLTDPALGGLPPERCVVLSDPEDIRTVYRSLKHYAALAEDTLIVYFAGHGLVGPRTDLYLALSDTDPEELGVSALAYDLVREVLNDCGAANRVVVLDCCFSGLGAADMADDESGLAGRLEISGTFVLTSAPRTGVSLAPEGATHTAFTGELLRLLRDGVPDGPELLTCGETYRRLLYTATVLRLPLPQQRVTGTIDGLALSRNPAFAATARRTGQTVPQFVPSPAPATSAGLGRTPPPSSTPPPLRGRTAAPGGGQAPLDPRDPPSRTNASRLLRHAGTAALVAMSLYGVGLLVNPFLRVVLYGWHSVTDPVAILIDEEGSFLSEFIRPVISIAIGVAVWRLTRSPLPRAWAGAGLLTGYGALNAMGIPYAVQADVYGSRNVAFTWLPEFIVGTRILLAVAAGTALVAVIGMRSSPLLSLRPRRGDAWSAVGVTLCALGMAGAQIAIWGADSDHTAAIWFMQIAVLVLGAALSLAVLCIRPAQLAAGLVSAWLVCAVDLLVGTACVWAALGSDEGATFSGPGPVWQSLFGSVASALALASWIHLHRTARTGLPAGPR